ncbi:hypothetical protein KY331_04205 [Candidatus Woesearchaeota archaeon]|nr:hypothetical protein [Candidatus Woesearchaeota archaeon]
MKRHKKDKDYISKIYKIGKKLEKKALDYIKDELPKISKLSDKELVKEYQKFANLFYDSFGASHVVESVALTTDVFIKDKLLDVLQKLNLVEKFPDYFTELTQPTRKFFFSEFNKSLLNLVNKKNSTDFDKLVDGHVKDFHWIKARWDLGQEYTKKDVLKELKELKSRKIEVTTDKQLKDNAEKKKKLYNELKLDEKFIDLLEITDFFTLWQDERKIMILRGNVAMEKFVHELAKRAKISVNNLKYLLPDELKDLKSIDENMLIERRKGSVILYHLNQRILLSDGDYLDFRRNMLNQRKEDDVKELNGMCASIGKAIGRVKVCLNKEDIPKVKQGDILVTSMTRPEFVPAMRKAAAIVTDEGGLTCHAAVISRELKKPCVIATKNATKVLKDGDLVDVNANHSMVKILK